MKERFRFWKMTNLFFICFVLLSVSCSRETVRRNRPLGPITGKKRMNDFFIKKKVVVLKILNESPYGGDDLGVTATEEIRKNLLKSKRYIFDGGLRDRLPTSGELFKGGGVKKSQILKMAKREGVNLVIFGRVISATVRHKNDDVGLLKEVYLLANSKVEVRVIDVESETEVFKKQSESFTEDKSYQFYEITEENQLTFRRELLRKSVKMAITQVVGKLINSTKKNEWSGKVAKILGKKIYVNAGRKSGVKIGDILKVMTRGENIYDPSSGALIGKSKGEVKSTIEIIDFFGVNGSVGVLHSGGSINEGDLIKLY